MERTGGKDCRITADDLGDNPGLELTMGDVDCSGNAKDPGFNGGNTLVTLKLSGTTKLRGGGSWTAGIWTREDRPGFVITSAAGKGEVSGRLEATGGRSGAGIGGRGWAGDPGGNITIIGGVVTATGGEGGAGIGGGEVGSGSDIRISGGTVTATGGRGGAGIGGGGGGSGSNIAISGGAVKATGGGGGAGIGAGTHYYAHGVYITGGTVSATGGCDSNDGCGLAIGHGGLAWGIDDSTKSDSVEVTGGSVKTTGSGDAARIGGITDKENPIQALLTLPAQWATEKNQITIDGSPWERFGAHPDNDWAWYAWLPKKSHRLRLGHLSCDVTWTGAEFVNTCETAYPVIDPDHLPVGTMSSVTVNILDPTALGGAEYSIDGGKTWQTSNTFSDLAAGTAYHVWARYKGDATRSPSEHLVVDVQTAPTIVPPKVLTSPVYSGQTYGDVELSQGWTWGPKLEKQITWGDSQEDQVTAGAWANTTMSVPQGQVFDYSEQELSSVGDGRKCEVFRLGMNPGESFSVRCIVRITLSRVSNEWKTPVDITEWDFGQQPNQPVGEAKYGQVKFSYSGTLTDGSSYGPTEDVPTRAGSYTLTAWVDKGVQGTDPAIGYAGLDKQTREFEIRQAGNDWETEPSIASWTFGQTPSTPVGKALHGDVEFSYRSAGDPSAEFVPWDDGPSAAGAYLLRAVVKDPDYGDLEKTVSFSVDQADAVFSQPAAKSGLVYTAQGQELVSGGVSDQGRFEYSLDGERWDAAVPVGVEAGEYQVWWQFVPDGNHTAGQDASGSVTVGIAAVKPTVTARPSGVISFGQGFADAGVMVSAVFDGKTVAGTTQWDGTDRELTVGFHKFTGTFIPTDTRNFESVLVTVRVQVDPVAAVVNGLEAVKNLVFNGKPQALVSAPAVTGGTVEYAVGSTRPTDDSTSWLAELPKATDAGEYTVFWRVVPDGNHTAIGGDVQVTVAAVGPTVTAKPAHPITYGQTFADADVTADAVFDGKPVEGTTQWSDTDRELTVGTHEFTGTFTPTDTKNFTPVPVTVTVEVKQIPAVVSGLEAVKNLVFNGKPQALVSAPAVTGGTVEYAVGATRPADDSTSWSAELPKATDAGDYTVYWRVVPDGNHTAISGDVQVAVAAAKPSVSAKPAREIRFGQKFPDAGVTVAAVFGGKSVEGTVQWVDVDRELSAGTHEFTGTFTPTDTKNFTSVPVTVTVQVGKAPATVTGLEPVKNLVFNGQPQALVTTPTVTGGTIEYAVGVSQPSSPDAWDQALPSGSHAGSATVFWRVVPDGNHTEVHGQVPVTIAPKVAAVDGQLARGFSFVAENGEYVIRDGQTRLSFGTDYTFELVNASFETQTADVEITFKGDYTGFAVVKNAMATEWGGVGPVEWKPGSGNPSFDLGEGSSPVTGVQVDDKPLPDGKFHRTPDGKLVVDSSVLEGLAAGDHTLEVRLEDGSVIVYPIRVLPTDKPAPLFTGEWLAWLLTWPILLWMVLRTFAPWLLPIFLK